MAPYPNAILDGISTTSMGMHAGISPRLLQPNQLAFMSNSTSRGGYPKSRPSIRKVPLTYATDVQTNATQGNFQCAQFYESYQGGENFLVASIGGRLFRYLVGSSNVVSDISISGDLNNPTTIQAWIWQGEDFLFVNDGLGYPLIYDGASVKRSLGPAGSQLPAGTVGHYCNGRNVMALPNRRAFIAGDLVYSKGGAGYYSGRDAIIGITENISILGGAAFSVPVNAGPINSMSSVALPDTSLGQGPLQIGTRKGVYSVNLPLDATTWTSLQFPSSVVSLPSSGPLSQNGIVNVNGDLWFRARDGFRSFSIARRDFNTWVQTPLSVEVDKIIKQDTGQLRQYGSAVHFDNRFLHTCSPYMVPDRGVAWRGMIALDFNNISNLTTRSNPSYDGLWNGLPILQILTGTFNNVERCFIFALDCSNNICLYELFTEDESRTDFDGITDIPIQSYIESGSLFGRESQPPQVRLPLKKLIVSDLFLDKLSGNVAFEAHYRSDQHPIWRAWKAFSICATAAVCNPTGSCPTFQNVLDQFSTFTRLPEPDDECSPASGRLYRTGYEFQIRLQWTGYAVLNRVMVWAVPMPETIPSCPGVGACRLITGCEENYFTYRIESTCPGQEIPAPIVPPPIPPAPPDEVPEWLPPDYVPDLGCDGQANAQSWLSGGLTYRYNSSGNQDSNPNEIFDSAFVTWWMEQVRAYFIAWAAANSITYSTYTFYWIWVGASNSWSAPVKFESDSNFLYVSAGWELEIRYCP